MSVAEALESIEGVEGWLSEDQAGRLFERARSVSPGGTILEIGSFRGRSTIVLARAAADGVTLYAVDPHAGSDRGPQEIHGNAEAGEADRAAFAANLERAGVAARVSHVRLPSAGALGRIAGPIDLLYVDGAHRYRAARGDLLAWGARVPAGGTMLVHDAFSSIGVTLAILRGLTFGGDFAYAGRTRSLAEYRRVAGPLRGRARVLNALRQLSELPWFARNVTVKLALVLKLRPVARGLGADGWPY